jgi:lactoylglutathione lyase
LFEAHLEMRELDRSIAFYRDVVGLELAHVLPERRVAFFWIGGPGRSRLGPWSGSTSPSVSRSRRRSRRPPPCAGSGSSRSTSTAEPSVIGWMPAAAVFFHDPHGHLLAYLGSDLVAYQAVTPSAA